MKVYNLESWRKENGIKNGVHPLWRGEETEQEFINRCMSFKTCDYCGQKIRVDLGRFGVYSDLDCGSWKCDEYSCDSYVCNDCVNQAHELILSTKERKKDV